MDPIVANLIVYRRPFTARATRETVIEASFIAPTHFCDKKRLGKVAEAIYSLRNCQLGAARAPLRSIQRHESLVREAPQWKYIIERYDP